ncbi:putative triacylglycerol lipase [Helianthus annuus]|nr:putative triacylglycerol lipase [Helianthus annuus]KAJ0838700.1 putative triacylglycerol lipase [Helianthus annuus]
MLLKVFLLCVYSSFYLCSSMGRTLIPQKNVSVSAVFVFGDSFVDQGNNNYINTLGKGNFLPYGKDFQGGKPTGRFSNGKTLPDLLVEAFGVKDYLPASLDPLIKDKDLQTGVSFASGGSGFDPLTTAETSAIPMSVQLDMFKQHILKLKRNIKEEAADNIIDNSVAVIVAGNNDLFLSLPNRRLQYDVPSYANMIVNLVLNFIQEIYRLGVRRIAVFSAPPIGCLPVVRTLDGGPHRKCADKENNAAQLFNSFLTQQVQLWATSYPQSRVGVIDYYNPLISIIENPHKYGFDVADRGCCGTGEIEVLFLCNKLTPTCPNDSKYFFWDGFHLTEKGNSIILYHILQDLLNSLF